jgi:two-component system chemotaxis response regulator CheB
LAEILGAGARIRVVEPGDGEQLRQGTAYIAPAEAHMVFESNSVRLLKGEKQQFTPPAVDPLFRSAATAFGPRVLAVVLTGGGRDGTAGLRAVKASGGLSLVQAPFEAQKESMPLNAIAGDDPDAVLRLAEIVTAIDELVHGRAVAVEAS